MTEDVVVEPLLLLSQVTRSFVGPPPVEALRGVDLTIHHGEFLAITGPSGAGKSTLLNVLGLLDVPSGGTYSVQGEVINRQQERRRNALRATLFGFVFQASHLLETRTVGQNVALALATQGVPRSARSDMVVSALERVGLGRKINSVARDLSGGERQRAAIARALVTNPLVLLADEPTGNLDTANAENIVSLLYAANDDGTTIVVVTHSDDVASSARRRVQVVDGRILT